MKLRNDKNNTRRTVDLIDSIDYLCLVPDEETWKWFIGFLVPRLEEEEIYLFN